MNVVSLPSFDSPVGVLHQVDRDEDTERDGEDRAHDALQQGADQCVIDTAAVGRRRQSAQRVGEPGRRRQSGQALGDDREEHPDQRDERDDDCQAHQDGRDDVLGTTTSADALGKWGP